MVFEGLFVKREDLQHSETLQNITEKKNQLDATYYFIALLIGSTCFGHYYAHHQQLTTLVLITPHWSFRSWFAVCWRLGAVGLE